MKITRRQLRKLVESVMNESSAGLTAAKDLGDALEKSLKANGVDLTRSKGAGADDMPGHINVKNGLYIGSISGADAQKLGGDSAVDAIAMTLNKRFSSKGMYFMHLGPSKDGSYHFASTTQASNTKMTDSSNDSIFDLDGDGDVDAADFLTPRPAKNAKGRRGRMSAGDVSRRLAPGVGDDPSFLK